MVTLNTIVGHTLFPVGFHTDQSVRRSINVTEDEARKFAAVIFIFNVLGYIPGVSLLSGIGRSIYFFYNFLKSPNLAHLLMVGRGLLEALVPGIQILLIIVDMLTTLPRELWLRSIFKEEASYDYNNLKAAL